MADDIDIEEHDLLEDPRIQSILPHFNIKAEPVDEPDYEEPAENYEEEYQYYQERDYQEEEDEEDGSYQTYSDMSAESIERPRSTDADPCNEIYRHNNKIILGSKPCPKMQSLGTSSSSKSQDAMLGPPALVAYGSITKPLKPIILGGKSKSEQPMILDAHNSRYTYVRPCPKSRKPKIVEEQDSGATILRSLLMEDSQEDEGSMSKPERVLEDAVVLLEDWGACLETSPCYCKECKTLFATQNALDAHNMSAHSFLVAMDSPEHSKSPELVKSPEKARYCNQCQTYFTDDNLLIQHLYEHLTMKNAIVKETERLFYKCPICFSFYASLHCFKRHTIRNHDISFDNIQKVPFKTICSICNRKTTMLSHNKHIQLVHKEYRKKVKKNADLKKVSHYEGTLPKLVRPLPKTAQKLPKGKSVKALPKAKHEKLPKKFDIKTPKVNRRAQYKCTKCLTIYSAKVVAAYHVKRKHPLEKTIVKIKPPEFGHKLINQYQHYKSLIPTNATFKCSKCEIHLICAVSVDIHSICPNAKKYICEICNRGFHYRDKFLHKQQHDYSDKIKTYTFSENIYRKILCKCPQCSVYFHERHFYRHRFDGCADTESAWCSVCKVKVDSLAAHTPNHSKKKPAKSDFIFVDNFFAPNGFDDSPKPKSPPKIENTSKTPNSDSKKSLKRKLPLEEVSAKKPKESKQVTFYYCKICHTFCKYYKSRKFHVAKFCVPQKNRVSYCPHCGLRFRMGHPIMLHKKDHAKYKWKVKDFLFLNIIDGKPITPPLPKFLSCKRCKSQHTSTTGHDCEGPKKTCTICDEKFDQAAYKLHAMHHKYLRQSDEVSELIQKYESLKSIWNIVYQCSSCEVASDSYDRAVEHCQNHLASASQSCATRVCEICVMHFEENSIKKHLELHANKDITKSSFNVLTYEYADLLKDNWLELFSPLSKAVVKQITSQSIYVTRAVKMTVILNGPPEFSIYKCETCKLYVAPSQVYDHTHTCKGPGSTFACDICSIPFSSSTGLKGHQKFHNNSNITANSCRIVSFNASSDKNFNSKLKYAEEHSNESFSEEIEQRSIESLTEEFDRDIADSGDVDKSDAKVTFYQCQHCKSSSMHECFLKTHSCIVKTEIWTCWSCPYITTYKNKNNHLNWHLANKHLSRKDIKMVPFTRLGVETDTAKNKRGCLWFQCLKCEVLLSSFTTAHVCYPKEAIRVCFKCKYKFHSRAYKHHEAEHQENKNLTREDIKVFPLGDSEKIADSPNVTPKVATLFKCSCGLHFPSEKSLEKHAGICSSSVVVSSENCSQCGLRFPTDLLVSHLCSHHSAETKSKIVVKTERQDDPSAVTKTFSAETKSKNVVKTERLDDPSAVKKTFSAETKSKNVVKTERLDDPSAVTKTISFENAFYDTNLHRCWCGLHFMTASSLNDHHYRMKDHLSSITETCPDCGLLFTSASLIKHRKIHHGLMKLTAQDLTVVTKDDVAVELKDSSLTSKRTNLNTVYECGKCHVFFAKSYLATKHYAKCPNSAVATEECTVCNVRFAARCLNVHKLYHARFPKFSFENLHVFVFKKGSNVKREKAGIKSDLETVDRDKNESNKLYKCSVCSIHCIDEGSFNEHLLGQHNEDRINCEFCGLAFAKDDLDRHTTIHHEQMDLKLEDFHIVAKEEASDIDDTSSSAIVEQPSTPKDSPGSSKKGLVVFHCKKCDITFMSFTSAKRHLTMKHKDGAVFNCNKCHLRFLKMSLLRHRNVHHGKKGCIRLESIAVTGYDQLDTADRNLSKGNTIYKCSVCELHFVCFSSLTEHLSNGNHDIPYTANCEDCGLKFTKLILPRHVTAHHTQRSMRLEDFRIQTEETTSIILNATRMKTCKSTNSRLVIKEAVDSSESLDKTLDKSDVNESMISFDLSLKVEDQDSMNDTDSQLDGSVNLNNTVDKESDESAISQSSELDVSSNEKLKNGKSHVFKLYKCGDCNVFFLNQSTCYKHTLNHTALDPKEYIECKLCSLQFKIISLAQHIKKHHSKTFDLNDVLVEEYQPKKKGQKTPKIDIYYAIDKVQSRLVSTTTEDEKVEAGRSNQDVTESHIDNPTDTVTVYCVIENDKSNRLLEENLDSSLIDRHKDSLGVNKPPASSELLDKDNTITAGTGDKDNNMPTSDGNNAIDPVNLESTNEPIISESLDRDETTDLVIEKDSNINGSSIPSSIKCSTVDE